MKKILIALLLLVIGAVAAAPFLIGSQIEKITNQLVDKSNEQLSQLAKNNPQVQGGSVALESYEKGYLNAKAKGVLEIAINNLGDSKAIKIPFESDITHGPYLGDAGFGLAKVVSRPDLSGFELPEAINADTVRVEGIIDFAQGITETVTVAPIKHTAETGNTIDFAGATISSKSTVKNRATFTADMQVKQLTLSDENEPNVLTVKPFQMDIAGKGDASMQEGSYEADSSAIEATVGEGVNIALAKMAISGNYKQAKNASIMLGDAKLSLSDLVVTNPEVLPGPFKLPLLSFSSKVEQAQNDDLTISAKYDGTLDPSMMKLMNSPVDVKNAVIDLQFRAIPVSVVTEYQELMNGLVSEKDQQKVAETLQAKSFELVQQLANNAAATTIKVEAKATEGELMADINAGFKPDIDFDAAQMMQLLAAPSPQSVLPLLVGRGDVSLSKGVTDKAGLTPMIQMMAAEFVELKDDKFVSDFQITDGQLLVNGKPLPFMPQ